MIPTTAWGNCVSPEGVATLRCIPVVLGNIINFLVLFAGIVCVFLIIYSGYKFITSEGDPERISMARKTLFYALGGFLFVLLSFFFLNIVAQFTGVQQIAPR
jgi:hypothetical protein